jgi:hypothetical protein
LEFRARKLRFRELCHLKSGTVTQSSSLIGARASGDLRPGACKRRGNGGFDCTNGTAKQLPGPRYDLTSSATPLRCCAVNLSWMRGNLAFRYPDRDLSLRELGWRVVDEDRAERLSTTRVKKVIQAADSDF